MAGKICPNCDRQTFFVSSAGRKCSKCGYEMRLSPNEGKGGRGKKCSNCDKHTVFNSRCTSCGAVYCISK